jgi:LacI family transcriptional regulator
MAVTMRELAKTAGVSLATVSLALRDHPRISPETRDRVKSIATESGYRPNPVVARLIAQVRASKTTTHQSTIGAILTGKLRECLGVFTFREWLAACKAQADRMGYGFDIFSLGERDFSLERLMKILDARRIQGLVVAGPAHERSILRNLEPLWQRSATVLLGERPTEPIFSCVLNNQFSTCITAFDELTRLGYQRPALCIQPEIDDILENRFLGGFLVRQAAIPTRQRVPPFRFALDGEPRFRRWMEQYRPDAVITLHYEILDWLETAGWAVPRDVGVAHLDWTPKLKGWAGTDQNNTHIGTSAIDMLIGKLHRNEFGAQAFQKCMIINSTWKDGQTVRQITQR